MRQASRREWSGGPRHAQMRCGHSRRTRRESGRVEQRGSADGCSQYHQVNETVSRCGSYPSNVEFSTAESSFPMPDDSEVTPATRLHNLGQGFYTDSYIGGGHDLLIPFL